MSSKNRSNRRSVVEKVKYDYPNIKPKNINQSIILSSIEKKPVTLINGPAGSGKTFLAVVKAIDMLEAGKVNKLIITRPAVTTEQIGFLPGDLEQKMDPLMAPIFDSIIDYRSPRYLETMLNTEFSLEIASFAYLRGRTFNSSFILVDEAQNCTIEQTKMMITRLGEYSTMVITGDTTQSDLRDKSKQDGLSWAISRLKDCSIVNYIQMADSDIVRSVALQQLMPFLQESVNETS